MSCSCNVKCVATPLKVSAPALTRALTSVSVVGGLLSSSCCVLQLALNALQLGCAGFAVLTPWTNHFRTVSLLALSHLLYQERFSRKSILTLGLTLGLMFSQDAVRYYNLSAGRHKPAATVSTKPSKSSEPQPRLEKPGPRANHSNDLRNTIAANAFGDFPDTQVEDQANNHEDLQPVPDTSKPLLATLTTHTPPAPAATGTDSSTLLNLHDSPTSDASDPHTGHGAYFRFQVAGIKCEGCAARLKSALLRLPGVSRCAVDFASGQVLVWGQPGAPLEVAQMRSAIQMVDLSYRPTLVEAWGV